MSAGNETAILMIAYTYYQSDSRVIREAEAALEAGFSVDFLALRRAGDPPAQNLRGVGLFHLAQSRYRGAGHLHYFLAYIQFFLRCFLKISILSLRRRYRVVHVNNMPDFLVFSTVVARLLGARVVLDIHDPMPTVFISKFPGRERSLPYRMLLWQELLSAWYADRVITVNDPVRDVVLASHGLAPSTIDVIANFPDLNVFVSRQPYRAGEQLRLVFHGTIVERAGLGNLIVALSKVRQRERIRALIIGEGDFSATLRMLISDYSLQSVVEFDNRSYPVHHIPERITACNAGIVPLEISLHTNYALPVKLVEYIALGMPVITVRSVGISHYFSEDDCLFYEWNEVDSLVRVLDVLAHKPEMLEHYRRRAVTLRDKFSWEVEKLKYVSLLGRLTGNARSFEHGTRMAGQLASE